MTYISMIVVSALAISTVACFLGKPKIGFAAFGVAMLGQAVWTIG